MLFVLLDNIRDFCMNCANLGRFVLHIEHSYLKTLTTLCRLRECCVCVFGMISCCQEAAPNS